jgi:hypothetical protein
MITSGFRLAIEWSNPYTEPPNGKRVLAEKYIGEKDSRSFPPEFVGLAPLGSGYVFTICHMSAPPKQLSQDALKSIRRKRLEKRATEKYPLFSDQVIQDEICKNPEYFEGITREDLATDKNNAINEWQNEYRKFLSSVNKESEGK